MNEKAKQKLIESGFKYLGSSIVGGNYREKFSAGNGTSTITYKSETRKFYYQNIDGYSETNIFVKGEFVKVKD